MASDVDKFSSWLKNLFGKEGKLLHAPFGRGREMYAYWAAGFSTSEIAEMFGCSSATAFKMIFKYLEDRNIELEKARQEIIEQKKRIESEKRD